MRATVLSLAALLTALVAAAPASAAEVLRFTPEADTYVDASQPDATFGAAEGMWVDTSPRREAFLRFWTAGLAGRQVVAVRLRLRQLDNADLGGRVLGLAATGWPEELRPSAKPAHDGRVLASLGRVAAGEDHVVTLDPSVVRDGVTALALDSVSSDGSRWASAETGTPPVLEVELASPAGFTADGLSLVASAKEGSSEPTYFASNRRVAVTAAGRTLALHGKHFDGVRLAWRDPAGGWSNATTGAVADGVLHGASASGDWPASILVVPTAGGEEAWAVWGRPVPDARSHRRTVGMRRLTGLDAAGGPRVGPLVVVDAAPLGSARPDLAFERTPSGAVRVCLVWTRKATDTRHELRTAWFTPGTDTPDLRGDRVLQVSESSKRYGTLVGAAGGVRAIARGDGGVLTTYVHDRADDAATWTAGATGPVISSRSGAVAAALASGEVVVAVERDVDAHRTNVFRLSASGRTLTKELSLGGAAQPALASDGVRATLLHTDAAGTTLRSRTRAANGTWTAADRIEVGEEGRGTVRHPNAVRESDGRVRVVFEGLDGPTPNQSAVVAFQRSF